MLQADLDDEPRGQLAVEQAAQDLRVRWMSAIDSPLSCRRSTIL
jgi:hypothetical protein